MFEIRQAGIKGFGVFASHRIARGTRILSERPLLSINDSDNSDILAAARRLSRGELQKLLELSVNENKRYSSLSLCDAVYKSLRLWAASGIGWSGLTVSGIRRDRAIFAAFYNNNFAIYDSSRRETKEICSARAVFPTVARINHSCVPNAQGNFNANLNGGSFTIHALRDIGHDDEITISYLHNELALKQERRQWLRDVYGFWCECEICRSGPRGILSQERREKLRHEMALVFHEGEPSVKNTAIKEDKSRELLDLIIDAYEQEGLAGRELASLYAAAAGLAATAFRHADVLKLRARSLELDRDAVGDNSPFYEASQSASGQVRFNESKGIPEKFRSIGTPAEEADLSYAPWT